MQEAVLGASGLSNNPSVRASNGVWITQNQVQT